MQSRETESPRQRSRHPISPPTPPHPVPTLTPTHPRSDWQYKAGAREEGVADSLSSMMGVPVSKALLWEGPPHTPTDHGAACD